MFHVTGFTELDLGDGVTGVIMSDLAVNYKAEAQMFDELTIDTHVGEFSRNSFRTFHRVTKGDLVVALAESGLVTFNYTTRKLAPVPEVFLKTLIEFTNAGS